MNIDMHWTKLLAGCEGATFASRLQRKRHNGKQARQAHKTELHDWENEGGNLAPSPEATGTLATTGSA